MPVKISVIIPTYNMASFLTGAVQSIVNNNFNDIELIIVDDGSVDNTTEVVQELKQQIKIPIFYHKINHRGKSGCINEILSGPFINGDYIVFMDADDLLPPHSLQVRYEAITQCQCDFMVGSFAVKTMQGKTLETRRLNKSSERDHLIQRFFFDLKSPFHLNAAILSRALLLKTGPFDVRLSRGQEVDYSIRLLRSARQFSILPHVVYYYRKYHRPISRRLKIRLRTMRCRRKTIGKYLKGWPKVKSASWQALLDSLKLGYELFRRY